jgi:hypothetical protein
VPNDFAELFCAGHILTADGRLLTIGGHNGSGVGTLDATLFDVATRQWTSLPDLNRARWYPSLVQLPDGRALALGGAISRPQIADIPETLSAGGSAWSLFPGAQKDVGEYPVVFPTFGGRVFVNGYQTIAVPTVPPAPPEYELSYDSWLYDVDASTWTLIGPAPAPGGAGVMYRPGKVMLTGGPTREGTDPVTRNTGVIDLAQNPPQWRQTAPMAFGRSQHNLVILPDGKVLVVGGAGEMSLISTNAVLTPEIWDPDSETWTQVAPMATPRMYHSIAILLPDGRVLAAGGGKLSPNIDQTNGEFYSPPYLFQPGARPTITSAPASVSYGLPFAISSPDAASIERVTFVRASSVTHGINLDQRFFELSFSRSGNTLTAMAPNDASSAPAGDYMVFVLNGEDVPSVARIVRLGGTPVPTSLSIDDPSALEGTSAPSQLTFAVSLSTASSQTVRVSYTTVNGAAQAGSDFASRSGILTFNPGVVTQTIAVPTIADAVVEPNESFTVQLSNAENATIADASGLATIINDDVPVVPVVSVNSVGVSEDSSGSPVATFTVSLSNAAALDALVGFRTVPGTATSPADFTSTAGTLTFAGGTTQQTIQVPIVPDRAAETDETFTVELHSPVNATLGAAIGTATILDDDTPGRPVTKTFVVAAGADDVNEDGAFFAADGPAWFGNAESAAASYLGLRFTGVSIPTAATIVAARLELMSTSTQWLSIAVELAAEASGNSAPFSDTARPSSRPLIAARVAHASDAQWLESTRYPLDDIRALIQQVVVQPGWSAGHAISLVLRGTGSSWARKHIASAEGGPAGAAHLVVTYSLPSPPNQPPVIVAAAASPSSGTAPLAVAFTGAATDPEGAPLAYTWAYGDGAYGSGPASSHVYAAPGLYSATLAVSDGEHVVTSGPIAVGVAAPGLPAVHIDDVSVLEGQSGTTAFTFTVSLSAPSGGPVTVGYATSDGTATAGPDYVPASGTVSFAPGVVSRPVTVSVVGDTTVEPTETFAVVLSGAAGAALGRSVGTATVVNDDVPPPLAARDLAATIARSVVHFTWQPPLMPAAIVGYQLEAGFAPGEAVLSLPLGLATSFATAAPDGVYYVRVRTVTGGGLGPASNELRIAVGAAAPPLAPVGLLASVQGTAVTLEWRESPHGSAPLGYHLHAGSAPGASNLGVVPLAAETRRLSVSVPPGTYYARVVAVNAAGPSPPSNEAVIAAGAGVCMAPLAPLGFTGRATPGAVALEWQPAAAGAAPTGYVLYAGRSSGSADIAVLPLPTAPTILGGPVPPGTYFLRIAAVNPCGMSAPSAELVVAVP